MIRCTEQSVEIQGSVVQMHTKEILKGSAGISFPGAHALEGNAGIDAGAYKTFPPPVCFIGPGGFLPQKSQAFAAVFQMRLRGKKAADNVAVSMQCK